MPLLVRKHRIRRRHDRLDMLRLLHPNDRARNRRMRQNPPHRQLRHRQPMPLPKRPQLLQRLHNPPKRRSLKIRQIPPRVRDLLAVRVFPRQQSAKQRRKRDRPNPVLQTIRQLRRLDLPRQQTVFRLQTFDIEIPRIHPHLIRVQIAHSKPPHLPVLLQLRERRRHLVRTRQRIPRVNLVKIDRLDPQPPQ